MDSSHLQGIVGSILLKLLPYFWLVSNGYYLTVAVKLKDFSAHLLTLSLKVLQLGGHIHISPSMA